MYQVKKLIYVVVLSVYHLRKCLDLDKRIIVFFAKDGKYVGGH